MNPQHMTSAAAPRTPKKVKEENILLKITTIVSSLSHEWDLKLELPPPGDSPSNRQHQTLAQKCVFMIKGLTFKDSIDSVLNDFYSQANILYNRWVHKPKGERGTVPEKTRHKPHPVSDKERHELQTLFYTIANREFTEVLQRQRGTPLSKNDRRHTLDEETATEEPHLESRPPLDDSPIPIANKLLSSARKPSLKRAAEPIYDEDKIFKRPPKQDSRVESDRTSFSAVASGEGTLKPPHEESTIMRVRLNDSFDSLAPSVFDTSFSIHRGLSDVFSTTSQATEPEDEMSEHHTNRVMKLPVDNGHHSSDYEVGSSFDARLSELVDVADSSARTVEGDERLEQRLDCPVEKDKPEVETKVQSLQESLRGIFRKFSSFYAVDYAVWRVVL